MADENAVLKPTDNSVSENLQVWNDKYGWPCDGDEWTEMADYCSRSYVEWRSSIERCLVAPFARTSRLTVEIGSGHGRWLDVLSKLSQQVIAVDVSESCLRYCQLRYADRANISYSLNDGRTLANVHDSSVDFVFSFDAFVHMDLDVIQDYLIEIRRVLRPGGIALLHHAGRADLPARFWPWMGRTAWGRKLYTVASLRRWPGRDGWRSDVSRPMMIRATATANLLVVAQTQRWGLGCQDDVRRFNDWISLLTRD